VQSSVVLETKETELVDWEQRKKKQRASLKVVAETEWRGEFGPVSVSGSGRRVRRLIERDASFKEGVSCHVVSLFRIAVAQG
jgi:hypothetical protein